MCAARLQPAQNGLERDNLEKMRDMSRKSETTTGCLPKKWQPKEPNLLGGGSAWVRGEWLVARRRRRVRSGESDRLAGGERLAARGKSFNPLGEIALPFGREDDS